MSKKYMLSIKRKHNDYLPLEWHLVKNYNGENLNTLEGIDQFTSVRNKVDLINEIISENIVDEEEKFQNFSIIYFENGRYRELKDGSIFKENSAVLNSQHIVKFLLLNLQNKSFINELNNIINKNSSKELLKFIYVIKNFKISNDETTYKRILYIFEQIPYEERRHLSFIISRK